MTSEFDAMKAIDEALTSLSDEERSRVLQWVDSKYSLPSRSNNQPPNVGETRLNGAKEIPGIARLTNDGTVKLTVRELKAKNTNDAAIRLVLIVAFAHEQLTGESSVSSKDVVVPALREWRAYTGNTRTAIANHRGIIREGDRISLDAHARKEAEEYIRQIMDDAVQGSWKLPAKKSKTKGRLIAVS